MMVGGHQPMSYYSHSPAGTDKVIKFRSNADGDKTELYDPAHCPELLSF